jgi:kinesin family protein 11
MSKTEMAHLQAQNALLVQIVEAEKMKSARANDELVEHISGLLGDLVASRDRELREAFGAVAKANTKHEEEFSKFGQRHERMMNDVAARGSETTTSMERRGTEGKRTRDGALKVSV